MHLPVQIAGKEQLVAGDPECSRHLELLLQAASTAQIIAFLQVGAPASSSDV